MKAMRFLKVFALISIGTVLMASCGTLPPGTLSQQTPGEATDGQSQSAAYPPAAQAAQKAAAAKLGIGVDAVTIENVQSMEWPDSCLGAAQPEKACAQVVTPGYQVTLKANGQNLVYNTDKEGKQVVEALSAEKRNHPSVLPGGKGEPQSPAAEAAQKALAAQLGLDISQVTVVNSQAMEWPNSCLGMQTAQEVCLSVITPGYQVTLQAGGKIYIYRTDEMGAIVRQGTGARQDTGAAQEAQPYPAPQSGGQPPSGDKSRTSKDPPPEPSGGEIGIPLATSNGAAADLAARLHANPDLVQVVSLTPQEFPNTCLGIYKGDIACAEGPVKGSIIILQAFGETYIYHSDLAGHTVVLAQVPVQPGDEELARQVLVNYFDLLSQKKFSEAAVYMAVKTGGNSNPNLDILRSYNSGVPGEDIEAQLEWGCTVNGLQCLPIDQIMAVAALQSGGYQFSVSFLNADGSRFSLNQPDNKPAMDKFTYTLVKDGDQFHVSELPPYQP